jgi:hypothetical protein
MSAERRVGSVFTEHTFSRALNSGENGPDWRITRFAIVGLLETLFRLLASSNAFELSTAPVIWDWAGDRLGVA